MSTSRRELFRFGAAAAVSCCFPQAVAAAVRQADGRANAARRAFLAEEPLLTRSALANQLDTSFAVEDGRAGRRLALRLQKVTDLPSAETSGMKGNDLCFSALFKGPLAAPLGQRTYRLSHRELGTFSVFLVPVGRTGPDRSYEATFNRLEA